MTSRASTVALYALTTFLIICGLAGDLISMLTPYWWTVKYGVGNVKMKEDIGILRRCQTSQTGETTCDFREDIFDFKYLTANKEIQLDIALILLLMSSAFGLFSLICILALLCCFKNGSSWKRGTICNMVLLAISALSAFGCLSYVETASDRIAYDKGWTPIVAWCAAIALLIGSILSCVLTCVPPKGQDGGHVNVQPYRLSPPRNSYWNSSYNNDK